MRARDKVMGRRKLGNIQAVKRTTCQIDADDVFIFLFSQQR